MLANSAPPESDRLGGHGSLPIEVRRAPPSAIGRHFSFFAVCRTPGINMAKWTRRGGWRELREAACTTPAYSVWHLRRARMASGRTRVRTLSSSPIALATTGDVVQQKPHPVGVKRGGRPTVGAGYRARAVTPSAHSVPMRSELRAVVATLAPLRHDRRRSDRRGWRSRCATKRPSKSVASPGHSISGSAVGHPLS